ncbi:DUF1186 domain-containing protein [Acidaminobacter sp.]|uniref:DUF1186 domain-containing protein n=1 Tax=Acidaminobacter sp. TaxID=1872102 RepID=UPI003FA437B4
MTEGRKFDESLYEKKLSALVGDQEEDEYELEDSGVGAELNDGSDYSNEPIGALLEKIAYNNGYFPRDILETLIRRKEEAIPELLKVLKMVGDEPVKFSKEKGYMGHLYAAHLLAQFRVREAYPILVDLMSLPGELSYDVFGEGILEVGGRCLASVCHGDLSLIKALAENSKADDFMRIQAVKALAVLVLQGELERSSVMAYYRQLLLDPGVRKRPELLSLLIITCCDLYPEDVYEDIKEIFKLKLNDRQIIDIDSVEEDMFVGKSARLEASKQKIHLQFIDDTILEMEDWFCFTENFRKYFDSKSEPSKIQEIAPKKPKIGRNDPCPCGSGKKYKKCCGK